MSGGPLWAGASAGGIVGARARARGLESGGESLDTGHRVTTGNGGYPSDHRGGLN